MSATAAAMDHHHGKMYLDDADPSISPDVSQLLLRAMNCIHKDEAVAIDLVKEASRLLRPFRSLAPGPTRVRNNTGGLAPWQVGRVDAYIEDNISRSIALDELAGLVRLSTSYFSTAFKVSYGVSPHSHILACRVEHAKHRMLYTDAPLCEIALDCGLSDQAHLSRVFRRATGMTPSAWRRFCVKPDAPRLSA